MLQNSIAVLVKISMESALTSRGIALADMRLSHDASKNLCITDI
jgi:hypothetical protein